MSEDGFLCLKLDVTNMFSDAIGERAGLGAAEVDGLAGRIEEITEDIARRRGDDIAFMELPYDEALARAITEKAGELRSWCRNFVVLGIGGSALGNITVLSALLHPFHNELPHGHPLRGGAPRIFVLDNVDPALIAALVDLLGEELPQTAFNVITKSGSTAETMSQFLHFRDLLRRTPGCDPARQMVLTTDPRPENSLLRGIAEADGYFTLPVPPNVGGRFSVLSAVGLFSAAVGGVDIDSLLAGAAAADRHCRRPDLHSNSAALYAAVQHLSYLKGRTVSVLMPYSHRLRPLAAWFCQLWAESLGKRESLTGEDVFSGPTPVPSVGVTDQHSTMQLYQDGPFDKVITFIEADSLDHDPAPICSGEAEPELDYLARHSFGDLMAGELAATRCALRDKGRPNCTVRVPRVDAMTLGELFMFFEYAVTYSGYLYGVNAFDQPGVELGKEYTYGLMGREGYEPPKLD